MDEQAASTPATATGDDEINPTKLSELEGSDPSLRALIKVLLDPKTQDAFSQGNNNLSEYVA